MSCIFGDGTLEAELNWRQLEPAADQTWVLNNKPAASVLSRCRLRSESVKRCSLAAGTARYLRVTQVATLMH